MTDSGDDVIPFNKVIQAAERAMGMTNWMVCGGIWMVCACGALLFMRGASIVNARAAELDDTPPELERRSSASGLRPALHASRSSLPRSAH